MDLRGAVTNSVYCTRQKPPKTRCCPYESRLYRGPPVLDRDTAPNVLRSRT